MKTKLTFLFAITILFSGCDLLKNATTVEIPTDLTADIPVVVVTPPTKSLDQAGGLAAINFSKSQDLDLSSNLEIEPYLEKIKKINLKSLLVTVNGLSSGQTINSVSLEVTGVGNIFTQTNITMSSNTFTPVISSATLDMVAAKLKSDMKITLTISGNVSGPMTFSVLLNFDSVVVAGVL